MNTGFVLACLMCVVLILIFAVIPPRPRFRLWQIFALTTLVGCLIGLGRWSVGVAREAALASSCHGRMFKIVVAMYEYRELNGVYLPRSAKNAQGQTLGWPELLAPFLAYEQMNARDFLAEHFRCSSGKQYLLVVGPDTLVQEQPVMPNRVLDGPANTLMAVEVASRDVPPSSNGELTFDNLDRVFADGRVAATDIHPSGRGLVFADGALCRLLRPLSVDQLRSLMTIDGGESMTRAQLEAAGYLNCLRGPYP